MTLVNLKQNPGESLSDFVARFNVEALTIENLDQGITQSLAKRPPQTFT